MKAGAEGVRGIERATRGLGIVSTPTSDNLTPQETTIQAAAHVWSCPDFVDTFQAY